MDKILNGVWGAVQEGIMQGLTPPANKGTNQGGNPNQNLYSALNQPVTWNQGGQGVVNSAPFGGQGPYVIRSKLTGRALDVSLTNDWGNWAGDLIIYNYVAGKNQQFTLEPVDGNHFYIRCLKTGQVLDANFQGHQQHNQPSNGPRVRQNEQTGANSQKWRFQEVEPGLGEYVIYCQTGKVMDVSGQDGSNNIPVVPWDYHGKDNQKWYITPASVTPQYPG